MYQRTQTSTIPILPVATDSSFADVGELPPLVSNDAACPNGSDRSSGDTSSELTSELDDIFLGSGSDLDSLERNTDTPPTSIGSGAPSFGSNSSFSAHSFELSDIFSNGFDRSTYTPPTSVGSEALSFSSVSSSSSSAESYSTVEFSDVFLDSASDLEVLEPDTHAQSIFDNDNEAPSISLGSIIEFTTIDPTERFSFHDDTGYTLKSTSSGRTYTIMSLIGSGGFGEVVRALSDDGREIAIKINRKIADDSDSTYHRSTGPASSSSEADAAMRRDFILHEHDVLVRISGLTDGEDSTGSFLVGMHECFQDVNNVYFVLPLYSSNLGDFCRLHLPPDIEMPHLTRAQIRLWAAELLLGLEALHKLNIVHRDLKPENILIDKGGHLAIADFGLAAVFPLDGNRHEDKTALRGRLMYDPFGTPGYFAPELCHPHMHMHGYDDRVDIWGFGVIVLEMATGLRCVTAGTPKQRYAAGKEFHRSVGSYLELCFGSSKSGEVWALKDLLRITLSRDPERRGTWAELKKHQFFDGVDWSAVQASRTGVIMPEVEKVRDSVYYPGARTGTLLDNKEYDVEFCAEGRRL